MKTHDAYREEISAYLDGEIDRSAEEVLFSHLAACPECRWWLANTADLRRTIARTEMLSATRNQMRSSGPRSSDPLVRAWQKRVPLPVAASIAVLLLLGSLLLSSSDRRGTHERSQFRAFTPVVQAASSTDN